MAATFTSATNTVLGNQRAIIGQVHMDSGSGYVIPGLRHVNACTISQVSCNTAGQKTVVLNGVAGQFYIGSCTAGDSFNFICLGY